MSCIKTAKNTLRKTIKARLALLEDNEKARQSLNVFNKVGFILTLYVNPINYNLKYCSSNS